MNQFWTTTTLLLLLLLRIAVPISITFLLGWGLRKLDTRWRQEAEEKMIMVQQGLEKDARPCWDVNNCSEDTKKECRAFSHPLTPCWDLFKTEEGHLSTNCKECHYREQAGIVQPVLAPNAQFRQGKTL